jgi:hypothetical protein
MPSKEKYVIRLLLIICLRENFHENSSNIGVYPKNFVRSSKSFRIREILRGSHLAANIFVIIIQVFLKMKSTPNTFADICQNFVSCKIILFHINFSRWFAYCLHFFIFLLKIVRKSFFPRKFPRMSLSSYTVCVYASDFAEIGLSRIFANKISIQHWVGNFFSKENESLVNDKFPVPVPIPNLAISKSSRISTNRPVSFLTNQFVWYRIPSYLQ